ncbi:cyanophycin synthetase [Brasilonema octagenarum UFV-E1]|uniref:Cyanophycin synthetase n=1 Tax=Brasilonema sennae CENA114 TaxID=415709 RepID=A0A856MBD2_9CYAN|nr:cyanophycin synthetase [Brasilonema sennae]QDL08565.1 cyanophycin synthetase [Brasilonema sennae CENA114]QDL14921.1 cyanophycin synthetase [Brasilonema octagenarum UFV-E1]
MRILKIQTLRGPNYWSIRRHKLIIMRLDLENLAETPTNEIPGFYEGLVEALPSLEGHFCSPGCRGGFLMRVREGTMMGHVVEHVALELQDLTGMNVGFGRTRETSTSGVYQVVLEYLNEEAGRYAGRAAVRLCQSIVDRGRYPKAELEQDLQDLKDLWRDAALGPSTDTLVKEAEKRGIPWMQLGARFLIQLGYGVNQKRVQATMTDHTSILGVELACDKEATKRVLANAGVPVPRGTVINFLDDLLEAIEYVGGYPIVIKPLDGNHGRGISINITSREEAEAAYDSARQVSRAIIVERYYTGRDHRVLVVDGKVVAVAERVPAHVVGNGKSTVFELIEETNKDPNRGDGHDNVLTKIELDRTSYQLLEKQGFTLNSVLPKNEICYLRATANLSTGGIAIDRTDEIHPENIWLAQRIVKVIGLDIAGIDIVTADISRPLREVDGVIVEVNAAPGFRMHVAPSQGISRNVGGAVIDMLFPADKITHIPILAVTGTNGKTTTTRLLAHIFKQTNKVIGYTTTDGTYIGDYLVESGDNTGPQSAQLILQDPTVEVAVLETARGGILRSGLAFENANVGVILNVASDHLGIGDIDTIDQLAHLKSVVAEAVFPDGYAVLNADDHRVAAMAEKTKANIAYFTMNPESELVRKHIQKGGVAAVYENGYLSILKGDWTHRIERAENIPLTMGGRAPFMIANALAASLAAFVQNVTIEQIRAGLNTFRASVSQTPGRMNLFNLGNYHALVDYAHNPASYQALGAFVRNWISGKRIGVVGGPGDRRDEDFVMLGKLAAEIFDSIIVKEDDDTRGRARGSAADLIVQGIKQVNPNYQHQKILSETEAVNRALDMAPDNSLVVILPESISRAIALITARGVVKDDILQQTNPSTIDSQVGVKSTVVNTLL